MTSADEDGLEGGATPHEERADALRRVELVPGYGEQIDAQLVDPRRDLAHGLGGVGVEEAPRSWATSAISATG